MKICLSSQQDAKYLERIDEIKFDYNDRHLILTYIDNYPNTTIILKCALNNQDIDWDEIKDLNYRAKENFILSIVDPQLIPICKEHNIKFYLNYPITSYDELSAVVEMGSYYVQLGAPLFFDLDNVKKFYPNIKIRFIPNVAYDDLYIRKNGITGTWIRPEDLKLYEEYGEAIEFEASNVKRERALYRIYIEEHKWPGDLEMIITGLNHPAVNRIILSETSEKRLNCRQICKSSKNCHICERALSLADVDKLEAYKASVETKYQAPQSIN